MAVNACRVKLSAIAVGKRSKDLQLFSYVVARDYGFAPNPFFGICTLATCKPGIRKSAQIGDWILGTGSTRHKKRGFIIFAMCVTETVSFNEYWENPRFNNKIPNLRGSIKQAFGDNIYHRDGYGCWHQLDSHHSYAGGKPNLHNIARDTQADRVLVSKDYAYYGGAGPKIPLKFRSWDGIDVCAGRGHKNAFPEALVSEFIAWFRSLGSSGYNGEPLDWPKK